VIFINLAEKKVCYAVLMWRIMFPSPLPKFLAKKLILQENISRAGWDSEVFLLILFFDTILPLRSEAFCGWRMR